MPIRIHINEERGVFVIEIAGKIVSGAMEAFLHELLADPAFRSGMNGLFDMRRFTSSELGPEEVRRCAEIASENEARFAGSRWAIVAPEHSVAFGMARMYELVRDAKSYEMHTFSDIEAARAWVGLD